MVLSILLLSGCTPKTEVKFKDLGMTKQQIFENNEACQNRREDVLNYLAETREMTGLPSELVEIFYSPEFNQCMFFEVRQLTQNPIKGVAYLITNVNEHSNIFLAIADKKTGILESPQSQCEGQGNGLLCAYQVIRKLKGQ